MDMAQVMHKRENTLEERKALCDKLEEFTCEKAGPIPEILVINGYHFHIGNLTAEEEQVIIETTERKVN